MKSDFVSTDFNSLGNRHYLDLIDYKKEYKKSLFSSIPIPFISVMDSEIFYFFDTFNV